jgi:hypothetical protein
MVAVSRGRENGCLGETRSCVWCDGPIPAKAQRDAVCRSVGCRQAPHRFPRGVGYADWVAPGRPLRLAYADPPYPGKAFPLAGLYLPPFRLAGSRVWVPAVKT